MTAVAVEAVSVTMIVPVRAVTAAVVIALTATAAVIAGVVII
jgi:hypothetical protein